MRRGEYIINSKYFKTGFTVEYLFLKTGFTVEYLIRLRLNVCLQCVGVSNILVAPGDIISDMPAAQAIHSSNALDTCVGRTGSLAIKSQTIFTVIVSL